jgi:hypothetical protein
MMGPESGEDRGAVSTVVADPVLDGPDHVVTVREEGLVREGAARAPKLGGDESSHAAAWSAEPVDGLESLRLSEDGRGQVGV